MARRYYSSTARRTTLASDINSSVTSLTVAAVSGWPSSFPYTLCIDEGTLSEELVEVTARSGTTVTVTRGVDGSSAVAHTAGATVNHAVSARDFNEPNQFLNEGGTISASGSSAALTIANTGSGDSLRVEDSSSPDSTPFVVSASGDVGVGTGSPAQKLDVVGTVASTGLAVTGTGLVSANSSGNAFEIRQTGSGNALVVEDSANPDATPFVVDTVGRVFRGTTAPIIGSITPSMQAAGVNSADAGFGLYGFNAANSGPQIEMGLSANASVGSHTVVNSGDNLGVVRFSGSDGTNFIRGAQIAAAVDGTPGTNDMPGRLVFSTTADGAATPTERMRITSAGNVGIGVTSPALPFTIGKGGGADPATSGTAQAGGIARLGSSGAAAVDVGTYASGTGWLQVANVTNLATNYNLALQPNGGNVGIGTSSPGGRLHVQASDSSVTTYVMQSIAETNRIHMRRANGTTSSPTGVGNGDWLGYVDFSGYDGSAYQVAARIRGSVDATPGTGDMPGGLSISLTADGGTTLTERMYINNAGLITGTGTSLGAWTAYTPTLGGTGWAIGNGTAIARYCVIGKTVHVMCEVTMGSTTTFGSAALRITLPSGYGFASNSRFVCSGLARDVSASKYYAVLGEVISTTEVAFYSHVASTTGELTGVISTAPYTWASTDYIRFSMTYEAA